MPGRKNRGTLPNDGKAHGMGWGGPAKGEGSKAVIVPGSLRGVEVMNAMTMDERKRAYLHSKECRDDMRRILVEIAQQGDGDGVRAMAANKMHELLDKSLAVQTEAVVEWDYSALSVAEMETMLAIGAKIRKKE